MVATLKSTFGPKMARVESSKDSREVAQNFDSPFKASNSQCPSETAIASACGDSSEMETNLRISGSWAEEKGMDSASSLERSGGDLEGFLMGK